MNSAQGSMPDAESTLQEIQAGNRRSLARALSFAESQNPVHAEWVSSVLSLAPSGPAPAFRVALSGPPGVGKSTLIERLGQCALAMGQRVAVLAVDPSSQKSGGSLLADKTRMPVLSGHPDALVRPSPSRNELGGVIHSLPVSVRLCELAGYGLILVETLGVGQSEQDAGDMVDCFVLLLSPHAGDEVQGLKRGITEICDFLVVNKIDMDEAGALAIQHAYESAFQLLRTERPITCLVSAQTGEGLPELWQKLWQFWRRLVQSGKLDDFRRTKTSRLFFRLAERELLRRVLQMPEVMTQLDDLRKQLDNGSLSLDGALASLRVPGQ